MSETSNTQRDHRIPIRLEVHCAFGRVEGTAMLANISYTGALIERTAMRPEIGTRVIVHVYLKPPGAFASATPFELTGRVIRHSPSGFAIEYENKLNSELRRMVDDAAAVVAASR